jgi:4-carboxymuconolactone decarboxylase
MTDEFDNKDTLAKGRALVEELNPGMEDVLEKRYGKYVPGIGKSVVDFAYGQQYSRPGLDLKSRYIATIAALTALGGQTSPQLKINIQGALNSGLTKEEIGEIIWQMSLYGGFPSSINALNTALEVFNEEE